VLATVGLAIVAGGLAATNRLPLAVVALPIGLTSAIMFVRHPNLMLALLPVIGACVPFTIGTGSQSPIVTALLVAAILLGIGAMRAVRCSDWSPGAWLTWPTIALVLVWVFALLWSEVELNPLVTIWATFPMAQLGGTAITVISAGVFLLSMSVGRNGPWIKIATWSFILCGFAALLAYLWWHEEVSLPFQTNGLFTMWVVTLSFGQALFNRTLPLPLRIALGLHALAWVYKAAVWQTWFFSGWLPTLFAVTILVFLRSKRLFALAGGVAGVVCAIKFDALYAVVWGTTVNKGDLSRLDIWQQSLDLFSQHPILGTGPAGYAVYFQSVYAGSAFSMSTHNNYMDVLLETGILGVVVFAWLLTALFIAGWRARMQWRSGFNGAFAQSAFAGLLGLIVAMAMGDWFIPFVYNQTIAGFRFTVHSWVFLGFLASLAITRPELIRATSHSR
jgi:O-antigen ligase